MSSSSILYDKKSDSLYIPIKKGEEAYFEEVEPNVIIEFNTKKQPIGIEVLKTSKILKMIF